MYRWGRYRGPVFYRTNMGLLKTFLSFAVGVYAGIYFDQNYQVARVDEPKEIWKKMRDFVEQYKKDSPPEPPKS